MGRKPTPTAVKKAKGNPGKRALPKNEPQLPLITAEDILKSLMDPAKQDQQRQNIILELSKIMQEMGTLDSAMIPIIELTADTLNQYILDKEIIRKLGFMVIVLNKKGILAQRINPAITDKNFQTRLLVKLYAELGLTPSARIRVQSMLKSNDPISDLIKRRTERRQ